MEYSSHDTIQKKLDYLAQHAHCADCGAVDFEMVSYGDGPQDGFTQCCNEKVCDRLNEYLFGNEEVSVHACCWAVAELKFKLQGVNLSKHHGMSRLSNNTIE